MDIPLNKCNIFRPTLKKVLLFLLLLFTINLGFFFCACISYTLDVGGFMSCPCGPFSFLARLSVFGMGPRNPIDYLLIQIPILYVLICLVFYGFKMIGRRH
jgi:hypothetical protein